MSEPSEKNIKAWEATRAKGKWHFILIKGVLIWGGLMFLGMGLLYPYLRHSTRAFTLHMLAINAVVYLIGGFVFGALVWLLAERNYAKRQRPLGNI